MKSQFEIMFDAVTESVPYLVKKGMLEKYPNDTVKMAVTLTRLANAQFDDAVIHHGEGTSAYFSKVSEYKIPSGFGYSDVIHYSGRVGSRALALTRGIYCVESKRPLFPESFELVKSADGKKVKETGDTPANYEVMKFDDVNALTLSPRELDAHIRTLSSFEKNWSMNTNEITKEEYLIDTMMGFYSSYDVTNNVAGELLTLDPSASGVSLTVTEFFLVTQTQDFGAEATSTIPESESLFTKYMRAEVGNHKTPQPVNDVDK